jgi:hypothetical protein
MIYKEFLCNGNIVSEKIYSLLMILKKNPFHLHYTWVHSNDPDLLEFKKNPEVRAPAF